MMLYTLSAGLAFAWFVVIVWEAGSALVELSAVECPRRIRPAQQRPRQRSLAFDGNSDV